MKRIFKSAFSISILIIISRILGLIRDIFFARFLGANIISDAFFIAFRLPNTFRRIFAEGAISDAFTPIFASEIKHNKTDALKFAATIFWILLITLLIITFLIEYIMPNFIHLLNIGLDTDSKKFKFVIEFSKISFYFLIFISIASFFGAITNSIYKFKYYAAAGTIFNISLIAGILIYQISSKNFKNIGHCLSWFFVLSGVLIMLYGLYGCWRHNVLPNFLQPKNDIKVKLMLKNLIPACISGGILQINIFIDGIFASFFQGATSYLYYTDRVGQFLLGVIGYSISTAMLPSMSKLSFKANDLKERLNMNVNITNIVIFLSLPITIMLFFTSYEVTKLFFERGAFLSSDTVVVGKMLSLYIISLPFNIMNKIFNTNFCSIKDLKTPMQINLISLVINVILNIILFKIIGQYCVIISTLLASCFSFILMMKILQKKKLYKIQKSNIIQFIKIFIVSIISVLIFKIIFNNINILLSFILSGISYLILCYIFKISEMQWLFNQIHGRLKVNSK